MNTVNEARIDSHRRRSKLDWRRTNAIIPSVFRDSKAGHHDERRVSSTKFCAITTNMRRHSFLYSWWLLEASATSV